MLLIISLILLVTAGLRAGYLIGRGHRKQARLSGSLPKQLKGSAAPPKLTVQESAKEAARPYFLLLESAGILYTNDAVLEFKRLGFHRRTCVFHPTADSAGHGFVFPGAYQDCRHGNFDCNHSSKKPFRMNRLVCIHCGKDAVGLYAIRTNGQLTETLRIAVLCLSCCHVEATQRLSEEDVDWVRSCEALAKRLHAKDDGPYRVPA